MRKEIRRLICQDYSVNQKYQNRSWENKMSAGIGGTPSVRGRFFRDIFEKKIRDPLIERKRQELKSSEENMSVLSGTAASAAEAELKKRKKLGLMGRSPTETGASSGYSVFKETLG